MNVDSTTFKHLPLTQWGASDDEEDVMILTFPAARAARRAPAHSPTPLTDLTADFLLDLQVAGRAAWTRCKHGQELRRYSVWLDSHELHWHDVTENDLVVYMRTRAHLGPSARGATTCALRVFHAWLVQRRYLSVSPAANLVGPTRPRPTPKALNKVQLRQLVAYLKSQLGMRARRDEVLVTTALYTGLRAAELAALRWDDLDLDACVLVIELSKANHGRALALHVDLVPLLRQWRQIQQPVSAYVFASTQDGRRVAPARVGKIVRKVARATGLRLHAHKLRHSFATWLLRTSKDLFALSKALGHRDLKQTEIYIPVAVDIDQIAEAVATMPGINDW